MSMIPTRAVPKWPVVNFSDTFAFDVMSMAIGVGAGALIFYLTQKFLLKKCIK